MDPLDTGDPSMFSCRTLGDTKYYSAVTSLIFVLATQAQTIAMALVAFIDAGADRTIDGMLYSDYALQNCSVRYLGFTQVTDPVTTFQVWPGFELHLIAGAISL
jgi:hypothetical protein